MRGVVHVWRSASKSGDTKTCTSDALNWCFAKMTRKAGIGHRHAHEGRHTAVSIMSSNGVPIQEISGTVGHKFTHATETVYRHVTVPAIQGGATVLDSVFDDDGNRIVATVIQAGTPQSAAKEPASATVSCVEQANRPGKRKAATLAASVCPAEDMPHACAQRHGRVPADVVARYREATGQ
jgi:hypothetical protein